MQQVDRRGKVGLFSIFAFFLLACACPISNPFAGKPSPEVSPAYTGVEFGDVVMAGGIGAQNMPLDVRDTFSPDAAVIYMVAQANSIEQGTTLFARWSRDEEPFEDTPPITADRLYEDTYVEFHLQPVSGTRFEPGEYTAQLFVNGNPGPQVTFTVR